MSHDVRGVEFYVEMLLAAETATLAYKNLLAGPAAPR
jgi:hypothetical protein